MKMIKAIIFDYDGVLVDSRDVGMKAYKAIADTFGRKAFASMADFQRVQKMSFKETFTQWGASTEQRIKEAEQLYRKVTTENREKITLIPGIKSLLQQLSKRYTLAIVSGTYRELIKPMLQHHDIEQYFSQVVTRDDVQNPKPHPEGLLACLRRLNIKPQETIFIGDMTIDIDMGHAAGVQTAILYPFSWNSMEDLKERNPDMLIEKPEDIFQAVNYG